jgi:hypothetical protein
VKALTFHVSMALDVTQRPTVVIRSTTAMMRQMKLTVRRLQWSAIVESSSVPRTTSAFPLDICVTVKMTAPMARTKCIVSVSDGMCFRACCDDVFYSLIVHDNVMCLLC